MSRPLVFVSQAVWVETIEAYNVAIEALMHHESASGENVALSAKLRKRLAMKLERELTRWKNTHSSSGISTTARSPKR